MDSIILANQFPQLDKFPQMQDGNIQEIDDGNSSRSGHKTYHFHNCRIMDSFNTRTITMENCGNKVPQVTMCSSFSCLFSFLSSCNVLFSDHRVSDDEKNDKDISLQPHAVSSTGMWVVRYSL